MKSRVKFQIVLKDGRIGWPANCPYCGAPTIAVPPSGSRSRALHEDANGQAHASTCAARVHIAQVVRRPLTTTKGKGLDALLPAVKK